MISLFALSLILTSICLLWSKAKGQFSGSIRLVARNGRTSSTLTAGRLEVYYNRRWGTVCNDSFGPSDATAACRELGFSGYLNYGTVGGSALGVPPASSSTPIWLDDLYCSSYATSLSQCTSRGIGVHNCGHSEDVTLSCRGNGALRLIRTTSLSTYSSNRGHLEVYYNGVWGTVCDDSFGQTDADVVCRQLGYASATNYGSVGSLGYTRGSGTIWLDDLRCTSSDLMLSTCSHRGFGNENCGHSEDVAITCSSSTNSYGQSNYGYGYQTTLSGAAIAGIVIGVLVPLGCIGVCVTVVVIAVCVGAASNRSRNHNVNAVTTTVGKPAATAAIVTNTSPYPGLNTNSAQPEVIPAPYPQASPQPYPLEKPPPGQVELQQYPAQVVPGQMAGPAYPPQSGVAPPYPTAGDPSYPPPSY